MYGLLLENLAEYVKSFYGDEKWEEIRQEAGISSPSFGTHTDFDESLLIFLAETAQEILGVDEREFMDQMGVYFVEFVGQYGYDRVLSVLGRHVRDFLNGLDNLHEYLKFSYPLMRAPSFICEDENRHGLTLHYRTKRRGFVYYTMGQIREVARHFYHKDMQIDLVQSDLLGETCHYTFKLSFDNRAFSLASLAMTREEKHLPISASVLFEIFPFCIVFGSDMVVRSIGNSLLVVLPDLLGKKIIAWFSLKRPMIEFKFQMILNRTNNIFELVTNKPVKEKPLTDRKAQMLLTAEEREAEGERRLRLKGQMIYMDNWDMIMFLGTPVMPKLTSLISTGLYINDLSMHDFSRDLMLAGTQQSVELKLALDQEQQKSKKLEESMRKLDEEMRRTDELLYQMIPRQVADRLRRGENPIDTCEMFNSVSILFSDVVTFTEICSRITPMEVVSMLNAMYSIFDNLTEKNNVYKVETIGDAYMVVSGAPEKEENHAEKTCDMALDMIDAITDLKDPSTGQHLKIRVGVHSGAVVAGIVGLKMPRYCLFGDSVNTASRMESTSQPMKIHISQTTRDALSSRYRINERGDTDVKGKGSMKTYWLQSCDTRIPLVHPVISQLKIPDMSKRKQAPVVSQPPIPSMMKAILPPSTTTLTAIVSDSSKPSSRRSSVTSTSSKGKRENKYAPVLLDEVVNSGEDDKGTSQSLTLASQKLAQAVDSTVEPEAPSQVPKEAPAAPAVVPKAAPTEPQPSREPPPRSALSSGRRGRANSLREIGTLSPSDVFGSLVSDTEDFLEELTTRQQVSLSALSSARSTARLLSPQRIDRPPSVTVKDANQRVEMNGDLRGRERLRKPMMDQLDEMVKNMDLGQPELPGMVYLNASSSVSDGNVFKGILSREPTHHHCYCYGYNGYLPATYQFPNAKEAQMLPPQCCPSYHQSQRMHSHTCTIL